MANRICSGKIDEARWDGNRKTSIDMPQRIDIEVRTVKLTRNGETVTYTTNRVKVHPGANKNENSAYWMQTVKECMNNMRSCRPELLSKSSTSSSQKVIHQEIKKPNSSGRGEDGNTKAMKSTKTLSSSERRVRQEMRISNFSDCSAQDLRLQTNAFESRKVINISQKMVPQNMRRPTFFGEGLTQNIGHQETKRAISSGEGSKSCLTQNIGHPKTKRVISSTKGSKSCLTQNIGHPETKGAISSGEGSKSCRSSFHPEVANRWKNFFEEDEKRKASSLLQNKPTQSLMDEIESSDGIETAEREKDPHWHQLHFKIEICYLRKKLYGIHVNSIQSHPISYKKVIILAYYIRVNLQNTKKCVPWLQCSNGKYCLNKKVVYIIACFPKNKYFGSHHCSYRAPVGKSQYLSTQYHYSNCLISTFEIKGNQIRKLPETETPNFKKLIRDVPVHKKR